MFDCYCTGVPHMPVNLPCLKRNYFIEKLNFFFCSWSESTRQPHLSGTDCAAGRGLVSPDSLGASGSTSRTHYTTLPLCWTQTYKSPSGAKIVFVCFCFLNITLNAQNITNPHSSCIASLSSCLWGAQRSRVGGLGKSCCSTLSQFFPSVYFSIITIIMGPNHLLRPLWHFQLLNLQLKMRWGLKHSCPPTLFRPAF